MSRLRDIVSYETSAGQLLEIDQVRATPISGDLTVRLPHFSYVWRRPVAVIVDDGEKEVRLPIVDVTLMAQAAFLAVGLSATLFGLMFRRSSKRGSKPTHGKTTE